MGLFKVLVTTKPKAKTASSSNLKLPPKKPDYTREIARGKEVARLIALGKGKPEDRTCTSEEMMVYMAEEGSIVYTKEKKYHWTGSVFRKRKDWKWIRRDKFGISHSKTLLSQGGDRGTKVWLYIGK